MTFSVNPPWKYPDMNIFLLRDDLLFHAWLRAVHQNANIAPQISHNRHQQTLSGISLEGWNISMKYGASYSQFKVVICSILKLSTKSILSVWIYWRSLCLLIEIKMFRMKTGILASDDVWLTSSQVRLSRRDGLGKIAIQNCNDK